MTETADSAIPTHESANLRKYTTRNRWYRRHIAGFHRRIAEQCEAAASGPPTGSVLDAGCGEGYLTDFLADRWPAARFTGVDADPDAVAYALARFGATDRLLFAPADITALPFSENAFDCTVCSQVLEHLDDPGAALRELLRVTRLRLVVSVPREPWFRLVNGTARLLGISPDPGHVQFWSVDGFVRFLAPYAESAPSVATYQYYQIARIDLMASADRTNA